MRTCFCGKEKDGKTQVCGNPGKAGQAAEAAEAAHEFVYIPVSNSAPLEVPSRNSID